jgi:hypothetical protein
VAFSRTGVATAIGVLAVVGAEGGQVTDFTDESLQLLDVPAWRPTPP